MALVGVERKALVSEPDALTTRPPPCVFILNKRPSGDNLPYSNRINGCSDFAFLSSSKIVNSVVTFYQI